MECPFAKARLEEMRLYLKHFPDYTTAQAMDDDDLKEILEHAIPSAWQKEMTRQGFEPINHTLNDIVEFCERMEVTESLSTPPGTKSNTNPSGGTSKAAKWQAKSSERGTKRKTDKTKFCVYHNTYGHDTGECKVMLAQAKKMRGQYEASGQGHGQGHGQGSRNRTWNRDKAEKDKKRREEMHAMISKAVKAAMKATKQSNYSMEEFEKLNIPDSSDSSDDE